MREWHKHITYDDDSFIMLYKGVDIGLSHEYIQDLHACTGMDLDDETIENMYNSCKAVIRDRKIEEILIPELS